MIRALQAEEYAELVAFVETLSDEEWEQPSLCADWSVRDVVAHLAAWDDMLVLGSVAAYPAALLRYLRRHNDGPPGGDPLPALRRRTGGERRLFDRLAPGAQLAEYVIHHQDIRRPLGRPRPIPPDRLRIALEGVSKLPGLHVKRRTAGLTLRATDLDWSHGHGPAVEAPAEALLLAMAGRAVGVDGLHD